jgi:hypothetical protein
MTTATDLLVILSFLSALYTLLGLLCAAAETLQPVWSRRPSRRRAQPATRGNDRRGSRRSRPRRRSRAASLRGLPYPGPPARTPG